MTLKGVTKLTCGLKNDIRNLVNFHVSSWNSENLHFDWIRLSKAYKFLDEKVQKSYVPWHWRVMQSLKINWLLVSKMTWGIWWILIQSVVSPEVFTLTCYFCQYHIKFQPKKYKRNWKRIQTLKKNWLFISKMTWGIWWTLTWPVESQWKFALWWANFVKRM